jgi:hypothetical protein
MTNEAATMAALDKAAAIASRMDLSRADAATLCDNYKSMRKWIVVALPLIKKIPVTGDKLGAVIESLVQIADTACPLGRVRKRARASARVANLMGIQFES